VIRVKKDVVRLQISVDDSFVVKVFQSADKLGDVKTGNLIRQAF
jgi:hypothetical protein